MTDDTNKDAPQEPSTEESAKVVDASSEESGTEHSAGRKSISNFSFSIWPPTQRTRDAIVQRLVSTLSSPSVLSKRYGVVPFEEASDVAIRIEEEAFAASGAATSPPDDDGIEILQIYSKEISRRMIDTVKARSAPAPPAPPSAADAKLVPKEEADADAGGKETEEDAASKDLI